MGDMSPEEILRRLKPVDISGGASTIETGPKYADRPKATPGRPIPRGSGDQAQAAEDALRRVTPVNLAGAGSTISDFGDGHRRAAVKGGFTAAPGAPRGQGQSLLAAYEQWRAARDGDAAEIQSLRKAIDDAEKSLRVSRDDVERARRKQARKAARRLAQARTEVALAGPSLEQRALAKSRSRMKKVLAAGGTAEEARSAGHDRYRKHGGRLPRAAWGRRVLG